MNTITLVPQGGLCNRLRAILSLLSLVRGPLEGVRVRVGWSAERECAARFDQLFLPLEDSRLLIAPRRWYDRPITRRNLHWPSLVRSCLYSRQYSNTPPPLESLQQQAGQHSGAVYVSTGMAFCDYSPEYIRQLRLQPHLQQKVDALSRDFDSHTLGIHIRRTDHVTAIAESPDALFEQAIAAAIERDEAARFYLATDDEPLKARLLALFPGRITAQSCSGTRADLCGMEEAVVDLWTLARTTGIIGSYWSSYTDTAAEIGGIPLTIIRKPSTPVNP